MNFVYRNATIEYLFTGESFKFSGYEEFTSPSTGIDTFFWIYTLPVSIDIEELCRTIETAKENLTFVLSNIKITNFYAFTLPVIYGLELETSNAYLRERINDYNKMLFDLEKTLPGFLVVDINEFYFNYGYSNVIDWKYYFLYRMPINPRLKNQFWDWFCLKLDTLKGVRAKCLVVDLDNTMWGGVLGEDGIEGIKFGGVYPGLVYFEFQKRLIDYYNAGIILGICSKNNIKDVLDLFDNNKLKINLNMFSSIKINWENKAENLRAISEDLNIGLNSIVFIDDNPTERELVKTLLPEVNVPDFPKNEFEIPEFIRTKLDPIFSIRKFSNEDTSKNKLYIENKLRLSESQKFENIDDFISNLKIEIVIKPVSDSSLSRCSQLTQKTNQFNTSTKRYSDADVLNLINECHDVWVVEVSDKFGSYGIVSVLIINKNNGLFMDTYLLSCRVLGKKVEYSILNSIILHYTALGFTQMNTVYKKSNKNQQIEVFLETFGFKKNGKINEDDEIEYNLNFMSASNLNTSEIHNINIEL